MKKIAVVGASIGGLVAAVNLRNMGFDVTIFEKGKSIGGLFSQVDTPFGHCELGMHVLYVTEEQRRLLVKIFGDIFIVKYGYELDIGAHYNNGILNTDSIYPDISHLATKDLIYSQIISKLPKKKCTSAADEFTRRFGSEAANTIYSPILEKLWNIDSRKLTAQSIHCYYDLRRIIVADKGASDDLKKDPYMDAIIGNPIQSEPAGKVYGDRCALFFKKDTKGISEVAISNLSKIGINTELTSNVNLHNDTLLLDDVPISNSFDACILASPLNALDKTLANSLTCNELSIFYFKIANSISNTLPSYYVLCHSPDLISSRIVNYKAYNFEKNEKLNHIIAIEVLHTVGKRPNHSDIKNELNQVLPGIKVEDVYLFPHSLKIVSPTLKNANILDTKTTALQTKFKGGPLFFVGMRTDKGVFFSHQTIGAACDAALECSKRLS
ncbi:NAD(P)/FAD-dependent oxidoreductase [uncultured Paraglaciecola sp.]|uniref:NAD(P)/FAD-dependent oxidoreductase n=1 Tax=uncultured Paraglaciecola sp. TaxID=1765024 RepID=UPI0026150EF0|nr:NAD(P)/FAD-dependent oxidoreductase [uncultured Paraglaciecola sp.]